MRLSRLTASLFSLGVFLSCASGLVNQAQAAGLVVGDEPLAVQTGADVLGAGGTAADAATATYFALAVTYPVAAGLGGGGICLVRDANSEAVESIDFLPRNARSGGPFAVPGNVRGFALLHTLHGKLPWQTLVARGERFAMLGFPMSRALAQRVTDSANVVRLDAGLARVFMDESGRMHREGDLLRNTELGETLSEIRTVGPSALYGSKIGSRLVSYTAQQGGTVALDELDRFAPTRTVAQVTDIAGEAVYLPAARTGSGKLSAQVFRDLAGRDVTAIGQPDVVASVNSALRGFGVAGLPNDLGATGFAAVDSDGQAVACAVTMSGPFGSGRTAENTGITLATAPSSGNVGLAVAFLTPVIASEGEGGALTMVGAGAGGPDAMAAMLYAVAARAHDETVQGIRSSDPRHSVNAIGCASNGCAATPGAAASGMAAIAGQ